MEMFWFRMSQI